MTAGSASGPAPVLVLGLGNLLLTDDGVGLKLLERVSQDARFEGLADFVDGGTQGLALLGYLERRRAVLILDAVGLGAEPGRVHVLRGPEIFGANAKATTAHEGGAAELLSMFRLLSSEMPDFAVVGIEPGKVATGIGLTAAVEAAVESAAQTASSVLSDWIALGARGRSDRLSDSC